MPLPLPLLPIQVSDPQDQITLVQGVMPDSINEWYTALALDKMGLDYSFQVPLGMVGIRGSQVIDFVVWKPIGGVPVFVQGAHWHDIRTEDEDILKQAAAQAWYRNPPVLLMEDETNTREKAYRACMEKIGP